MSHVYSCERIPNSKPDSFYYAGRKTLLMRQTVVDRANYFFGNETNALSMNEDNSSALIYSIIGGEDKLETFRSSGKYFFKVSLA